MARLRHKRDHYTTVLIWSVPATIAGILAWTFVTRPWPTHTIEIDKFVPLSEIDERYFDAPYHIGPNDEVGVEAFAVIREAMKNKKMSALVASSSPSVNVPSSSVLSAKVSKASATLPLRGTRRG